MDTHVGLAVLLRRPPHHRHRLLRDNNQGGAGGGVGNHGQGELVRFRVHVLQSFLLILIDHIHSPLWRWRLLRSLQLLPRESLPDVSQCVRQLAQSQTLQ